MGHFFHRLHKLKNKLPKPCLRPLCFGTAKLTEDYGMVEEQAIPTFWLVSTSCYQEKGVWIREDVLLCMAKCLGCALDKWKCGLNLHLLVYLPKQPLSVLLNKNWK